MAYDSARISSERQSRTWKDLNLNFSKNPVTGDITKLSGTESVKRSVRNLIQTNHYEKPFHPEIGSGIRDLLFEPATPLTEIFLAKKIEETLVNFEPRVRLIAVNVNAQPDENSYRVWIEFYVVNHPTPVIIDTFLERLR